MTTGNPSESPPKPSGYDRSIARWTLVVGIFTGLLFAATGISAYFLYSTDSAIHKTLLIGQRAFVHLEGISFPVIEKWSKNEGCCVFNVPRKEGAVIKAEFKLTNSGNTPTKNLKIRIQCQPLGPGTKINDPFDLFKRDDPAIIERSLGAKQTIPVAPDACEFKDDDTLLNVQMGIVRRFLLGEVTYEDWVEPGHLHRTRFAHELVVREPGNRAGSPANNGLTGAVLISDPVGRNNCTDEDCK